MTSLPINLDPTILSLGPLLITWHGFFTAIGTVLGIWLAVRLARRAGFEDDTVTTVALWGVGGAIVGARLFHVVDQWDSYSHNLLQIVKINEGGLAIYGAIVGGPLVGAIYAWRRGLNVACLIDITTIPLILGMAIGRIGDIINGEHHGVEAQGFPLAVTYTNPNTLGQIGVPVHLAVGYEMLLDLVIFVFLLWLARGIDRQAGKLRWNWQPRYPRDGMLFWVFLTLYSLERFAIEFYRVDTVFALGISQSQLLSVAGALVGVWALVFLQARSNVRGTSPRGVAAS